ncbi:MAG: hypothetical protein H0V24_10585 [Chloroflexia bacterium]|nr:hypothetical protein [Chloroflexia bacterium]
MSDQESLNVQPDETVSTLDVRVIVERESTHLLLLPITARIGEFAGLPGNWDADDADPITSPAVAGAINLIMLVASPPEAIRDVTPRLAIPTTSSPLPDGGIQVEWSGNADRIDVQIGPDGSLGYLVKWGGGSEARYEETDEATVERIIELIHQVIWPRLSARRG